MWHNNDIGAASGTFESPVRFQSQGGFITSPGTFGTPLPINYNKIQRDFMNNVVPVTVAQIWRSEEDEEIKVGNSIAHILSLVGKLTFIEKRSTCFKYNLDDMSGPPIQINYWLGLDEKAPDELRFLSKFFPYAHVFGKLRCIQGKRFLHATKISPVRDANEITMHLLEVIHASMSIHLKEKSVDITVTVPHSSTSAISASYQTAYMNSAKHEDANLSKGDQTPQASLKTRPMTVKGLNKEQEMILRIISTTKSPVGVGYDNLFSSLKSLNKHVILQTVEFLINEGHIYNTIDDDHFLATDNELFQ